jgi:aminoglycoside phosphotransferase (APT) family kinase protein
MIDEILVRRLIAGQFPEWKELPLRAAQPGGWDNRTFRLGAEMVVRMPSAEPYAAQVEKEQKWLPRLAPLLPVSIPEPVAIGKPGEGYPYSWSIYRYLEGEPVSSRPTEDFAASLGQFLAALQAVDASEGPPPGPHSFYRGGELTIYDGQTREAIEKLQDKIDVGRATQLWKEALATRWKKPPVWVHGDISAGNLLVIEGRLSAVIDFGQLTVGDPACDLAIAWTLFKGEVRAFFQASLPLDEETWARGRAWALWKALITAAGLTETNSREGEECWHTLEELNVC